MKKLYSLMAMALVMPTVALAQQPAGMSQEQMMQMMQQAQKMQECMSRVDQQALMQIGQRAKEMESEVKALCQAGKQKDAERTAMKFGLEISGDENVKTARECGEMMRGSMPDIKYPTSEKDFKDRNICDGY